MVEVTLGRIHVRDTKVTRALRAVVGLIILVAVALVVHAALAVARAGIWALEKQNKGR